MSDLISREALMEYARNHVGHTIDCNDIARFPAVEAELVRKIEQLGQEQQETRMEFVKRGEWKEWRPGNCCLIMTGEEMLWMCSECGVKYSDKKGMNYCPNCGAKMGGAEECR